MSALCLTCLETAERSALDLQLHPRSQVSVVFDHRDKGSQAVPRGPGCKGFW